MVTVDTGLGVDIIAIGFNKTRLVCAVLVAENMSLGGWLLIGLVIGLRSSTLNYLLILF